MRLLFPRVSAYVRGAGACSALQLGPVTQQRVLTCTFSLFFLGQVPTRGAAGRRAPGGQPRGAPEVGTWLWAASSMAP